MSENTKIEWCDHTFNPWEGCQKVGPGCDNCYAEARNARFSGGIAINWGSSAPRRRTSATNWNKPLAWSRNHDKFYAEYGRRQRVFCASLADVFDNAVDPQWREDLFTLIRQTPQLDWLLLTKRIGNVPAMASIIPGWMPENVWLGATIVNQSEADRDIPKLLAVPASVRFLSMEPLLGTVSLTRIPAGGGWYDALGGWRNVLERFPGFDNTIDWVIVGGESGHSARPMHPDWVRSLRDQCQAADVPFLFKQWGEWAPGECVPSEISGYHADAHWFDEQWSFGATNMSEPEDGWTDPPDMYRVGKKAAGRHIDGVQHDGYPKVTA